MSQPADTRTMRIVHNALRRDLPRARQVLTTEPYPHPRQRESLAAHLVWMMAFLHEHHTSEDDGLYPVVRAKNPAARALLADMDRDHAAIGPDMDELTAAADAYAKDESARERVVAAIEALDTTLLPHLVREEEEMMPVVAASITQADWDTWDDDFNVGPKPKRRLAAEGLWIMEGQTAEDRSIIERLVPPIPRWIILNIASRGYRKQCFSRWQDQADAPYRVAVKGSTTVDVAATPDQVWAILSDVTRVPEWSHECHQVAWAKGSEHGGVGSRFRGSNSAGSLRWARPCRITAWEPGRRLVFETRGPLGSDSSEWGFRLEPHDAGTRITQDFRVLRLAGWMARFIWAMIPSHHDRSEALRQDLERLGGVAARESQPAPSSSK